MKAEIKVPAMGESISEAVVGTILKPTGSQVSADDEILELETDKVNQVLYAPQSGLVTISVKPEQVVKIGQVIGYVESQADAEQKAPVLEEPKPPAARTEAPKTQPPPKEASPPGKRGRKKRSLDQGSFSKRSCFGACC